MAQLIVSTIKLGMVNEMSKRFVQLVVFLIILMLPTQTIQAAHKTVVIDPGHGGDPHEKEENGGAHYGNKYEKDLNLTVAKAMAEELDTYKGVRVYLTRNTDQEMGLEERCDFAKSVSADFMISIHFNASVNHFFYGSEVWVSAFDQYFSSGYSLASCFMENFSKQGLLDRGIKTRIGKAGDDYYGIIRHARANGFPAILVEHAYMDAKEDSSYISDEDSLINYGKEDARAVADYYGLNKDAEPEKIIPTVSIPVLTEPVLPDETAPQDVALSLISVNWAEKCISAVVSAKEEESRILYYGYSYDYGKTYSRLQPWTGNETGEMQVEIPYENENVSSLKTIVYNAHNMSTSSNEIDINLKEEKDPGEIGVRGNYDLGDAFDLEGLEQENAKVRDTTLVENSESVFSIYEIVFFVLAATFLLLLSILLVLMFNPRRLHKRKKRINRK